MNPSGVLDVYFTVDVEVWCNGWTDIDRQFPGAFRRYVYGPTSRGDYALPYTIRLLRDHGLVGSFFVEPLFSARFGAQPLVEIVGLLAEGDQEIQLHLHTEWVDEAHTPLLPGPQGKRQFLRQFSLEEQVVLIEAGRRLIEAAGAPPVAAFRAGSFGFNRDTLAALERVGIPLDASYNATMFGPTSGVLPGRLATDAFRHGEVCELPMTVFRDGLFRLRHVQLTACSWGEIEMALWGALESGQRSFVILSHNFELMDPQGTRPDDIVVRRYQELCRFLDRRRDMFRLRRFSDGPPATAEDQPPALRASSWRTAGRLLEQVWRRRIA